MTLLQPFRERPRRVGAGGRGDVPLLPHHWSGLLLLAALVMAGVLVVGGRAWVLTRTDWRPVAGPVVTVDPALLRSDAERSATMLAGTCKGPVVQTSGWRLGPRLELHVTPGDAATVPLPGHRVASVLRRAIAAFGEHPGPCGRGPFGRWAEVGDDSVSGAGIDLGRRGAVCGEPDGTSVVEWGELPGPRLAYTCVFTELDSDGVPRVVEIDLRLDRGELWSTRLRGCEASYDLQSVLTHELGHAVGLWHPDTPQAGSASTMSRAMSPCDLSGRTLTGQDLVALGDLVS